MEGITKTTTTAAATGGCQRKLLYRMHLPLLIAILLLMLIMQLGSCFHIDASRYVAKFLMLPINFGCSHLYNLVHTIAHGIWLMVEWVTPSLKEILLPLCAIVLAFFVCFVCFVWGATKTVNWMFILIRTLVTLPVGLQAVNMWFPMMASNTSKCLMLVQHAMPCSIQMWRMHGNIGSLKEVEELQNTDDPQACENYKLKQESLRWAKLQRWVYGAVPCFPMGLLFMLTLFSGDHHGAAWIAGVLSGDPCADAKTCIIDPHEGLRLCILLSRLGTVSMLLCAVPYNCSPTQATVDSSVSTLKKKATKIEELADSTHQTQLAQHAGEMCFSTACFTCVLPLFLLCFSVHMYCVDFEDNDGIALPLDEVTQSVTEITLAKMVTCVYHAATVSFILRFIAYVLWEAYL